MSERKRASGERDVRVKKHSGTCEWLSLFYAWMNMDAWTARCLFEHLVKKTNGATSILYKYTQNELRTDTQFSHDERE